MSSTDHLSELESLRSQVADLSRALAERDHSMQDLREQSQLLRTIIEGTAAETGDEFFASLVTHLTSTLHVQYAVIGEVFEGRSRKICTLAVSAGGTLADNFEYELAHTPCATALAQTFTCFDRDVRATFPQFQRLADLGAESYCAVPLRTKGGAVIGLLVVMDTKPLENSDYLQSLLGVFAPRVAAEVDRRRTRQEHAQALADLHNIMETVPDIMFTLDNQGSMVKWNRRVEEVTGYSPEELLGMPALAFVPPEEQTRTAAAIQRAFTEGYAELEGRLLTKEHRLIPYHWTGALLKNPHGEPIGITGIGRDVSDKKRAEEELKQQRRRLVDAQAIAHLGSWEWDVDSGEVQWSDELYRIFGHEPGSIRVTYDTFLAALLPDDHDLVLAAINNALIGKMPYDIEYRIVRPNGDVRVVHARGEVHRDATGHPLSMAGTVLDITERNQVEEALRASEERWQLAVRGSNDGIWDWNIQTGEVYFSARWKAMRGYEESELASSISEWQSRIHPDDLERVLQRIDQYLARQRPEYCEEYRVERKDGSYMWVLDRGMALWADDGTPLRMAGSETDITERKRAYSLLMAVINSTADGLLAVDREGKVTIANKRFLELWRIPKALLDRGDDAALLDFVLEQLQEPEAFLRRVRELYAHPEQESLDMLTFKDGRVLERYSRAQVLKEEAEEEEEIVGRVWSFRDFTVRLRTEEALRASEERFALAVEGSSDIFWDASRLPGEPWYAPQTPVWWSPRIRELLGLQESELFETFEQWAVRLHPDDKDRVLGQLAAHIEQRVPYDAEYRVRTNRGDYCWIRGRGQALWDDQGAPHRMSGSCQDITERKRAQEALADSERQLRTVLDALPVGVWFTDRSGKLLFGNPAAKEIWSNIKQIGLQTPDNQSSWWETIGPANAPHRWALSRVLTTGVPSLGETFDLECLDGTKKVIRNSTVPVQDEAGNILGAIVLNEDVTMLRQAQAALQLTQFSVDHAVEGFFWIGPDAGIFHVNDTACRMLEYTWEELTTMTVHDIDPNFPPEVWGAHWEELKQKGSMTFESKHWSRTGRVLDTEVTVNYLQYEGKEYNCAIMRDIGERKRAAEALLRSDGRFKTMFTQASVGIALIDSLTGQIHEANDAYAQIVGRTTEEMRGLDWMRITHMDDVQVDLDNMARLCTGEITGYQMEKRLVCPDGTIVWIHLTVAPIQLEAYAGPHHVAMIEDITARKQVEEALRQSEERLRSFMTNSPSLVFFKALDGRYLYVNRQFERLFKLPEGHIIGKTDYEVFSREQADQFAVNDLRVLHERHAVETEETASYEDGTHISLVVKFPVCDADGAVWGIGGIVTDITPRKRAEEALRTSEEQFRTMFTHAPIGMALIDSLTGRIHEVNDAYAQIAGRTMEEMRSLDWISITHPDDVQADLDNMARLNAGEIAEFQMEKRYVRPDGTVAWVNLTAAPIQIEQHAGTRHLAMIEDITERKADEQLLAGEKHILEMIATDVPLQEVLTLMCQSFEELSNRAHYSILLLDPDGLHLRHGAAPSLPEAYNHAIDGLAIGPTAGSCGTAVFTRHQVIVSDIARDPLWADYRDLGLRHGLQACWSTPIIASDDTVLGTFAVYYGKPQLPTNHDLRLIERATQLACIAIERKRAAQEQHRLIKNLTQSQQHFQTLFNWTPSAVGISTVAEGRFCDVNEGFSRLTGYAREEVIGRTTVELGLWADPSERATMLRDIQKQGYLHNWEGLLRTKSGEIRSLMVSVDLIQLGSTPCLIYLGHDVTERKRTEKALRLAKFSMDRAADAVYWIDPQAKILDVNEAASLMLGYSKDELCTMTVHDLNPDFPADMWPGFWAEIQQRGTMVVETAHRAKNGRLIPIEVSVNYLFYEGKEYHCAFVRNITDRKRAEEVLHQRERDLRIAIEERERISQDLHDGILQSLFAVGLTLETTKSLMSPRTRKISGPPLNQAIEQLNRVMHEIRNFIAGLGSDLLQGKDLPTALQHMLASLTENQATRVRLAVEDRAAKAVSAEQSLHLFLVIQEAVSNCIQHGHAQEARVSLKMLKQGVRLSIRDNGRGFNPDAAKGIGHGLSNMAARAQKIGGRFTLLSKVKEGTSIVLDLPARQGA